MELLNTIDSPKDLKKLTKEQLPTLSNQIRNALLQKLNATGGHFGPNLGMVEATVALHYVFDSPVDKFVYDVSHQSYTHKILTGRKDGFLEADKYSKYTGYTNPDESEHDFFTVGHTSTSVSLATGLAKARDLKGDNENIVAVIGDGSLSGGQAYEGLNNAAVLNSNIIILVNDNDMSIAENQGGLYQNLAALRESKGEAKDNFFKSLGFVYEYIDDGHDFDSLISTFTKVKDTNLPTVIHMHTTKGKGLAIAEELKEEWHWAMPGALDPKTETVSTTVSETYGTLTAEYITKKYQEDSRVIALSPATPSVTGFDKDFRERAGKHYLDVGIAEEHAIAMISGIAKNGGKPILGVMSSFIQRTYDQLSQDLALNSNPATILVFSGGISGADATHLGTFDISMVSNIPNLVYLAPTTKEEYLAMLDWSVDQNEYPVVIRVPSGKVVSTGITDTKDYAKLNTFTKVADGNTVAIIGLGSFFHLGQQVKEALMKDLGIEATVINPHYITGIDKLMLEELKDNHQVVITLEDGMLDGGFGEKISRYYGSADMKVLNFGSDKEFSDRVPLAELYQRYHLTEELIIEDIKNCLK